MNDEYYKQKYLKYKMKYLDLQNKIGGTGSKSNFRNIAETIKSEIKNTKAFKNINKDFCIKCCKKNKLGVSLCPDCNCSKLSAKSTKLSSKLKCLLPSGDCGARLIKEADIESRCSNPYYYKKINLLIHPDKYTNEPECQKYAECKMKLCNKIKAES
jgi:hypothetical protein